MGAALRGRDQVDVALGQLVAAFGLPGDSPFQLLFCLYMLAEKQVCRDNRLLVQFIQHVIAQAVSVVPG